MNNETEENEIERMRLTAASLADSRPAISAMAAYIQSDEFKALMAECAALSAMALSECFRGIEKSIAPHFFTQRRISEAYGFKPVASSLIEFTDTQSENN